MRAANVLNGTDANCTNWIKTYKDYKPAEGGAAAASRSADGAVSGRRGRTQARSQGRSAEHAADSPSTVPP